VEQSFTFKLEQAEGLRLPSLKTDTLPLFRVVRPDFSKRFVKTFIDCVFDKKAASIENIGASTFVKVGPGTLLVEFDRDNHVIDITNRAFVNKREYADAAVAIAQVQTQARGLLTEYHLNYGELEASRVLDNRRGNGCYTVLFERRLANLPYRLTGDRILVDISPDGTLRSILIDWSELCFVADYPVLTPEEAIAAVNRGEGRIVEVETFDGDHELCGKIGHMELVYGGGAGVSGYLQPFYYLSVPTANGDSLSIQVQAIRHEYLSVEYEEPF